MHEVPYARDRELQMHITRHHRFSRRRVRAGNGPCVRARLQFLACAHRKQEIHFGPVTALQHFLLENLVRVGCREIAEHVQPDQDAVHRAPGSRLIPQQGEFERQPAAVPREVGIDAARVRIEPRAILCRHGHIRIFGNPPQPQPPRFPVRQQRRRAHDLREIARGQPSQSVHLPHALLRRHIALREKQIVLIGCGDVRFAQAIERDRDLLRHACADRSSAVHSCVAPVKASLVPSGETAMLPPLTSRPLAGCGRRSLLPLLRPSGRGRSGRRRSGRRPGN